MQIVEYTKCVCGAITLFGDDGRSYSVSAKNLKRFLPSLDLRKVKRLYIAGRDMTVCCDHCVNHFGLDLCACGSGEPFETCKGGFEECGKPMHILGRDVSCADKGWLSGRI